MKLARAELKWKRVFIALGIAAGTVVTMVVGFYLVVFFVLFMAPDEPPAFFPLNNPEAKYVIKKASIVAQGTSEELQNEHDDSSLPEKYYVEYHGDGVFMDKKSNFFRIIVGKSSVDLEQYLGKDVTVTDGRFSIRAEQCVANKCIGLGTSWVALDIFKVE